MASRRSQQDMERDDGQRTDSDNDELNLASDYDVLSGPSTKVRPVKLDPLVNERNPILEAEVDKKCEIEDVRERRKKRQQTLTMLLQARCVDSDDDDDVLVRAGLPQTQPPSFTTAHTNPPAQPKRRRERTLTGESPRLSKRQEMDSDSMDDLYNDPESSRPATPASSAGQPMTASPQGQHGMARQIAPHRPIAPLRGPRPGQQATYPTTVASEPSQSQQGIMGPPTGFPRPSVSQQRHTPMAATPGQFQSQRDMMGPLAGFPGSTVGQYGHNPMQEPYARPTSAFSRPIAGPNIGQYGSDPMTATPGQFQDPFTRPVSSLSGPNVGQYGNAPATATSTSGFSPHSMQRSTSAPFEHPPSFPYPGQGGVRPTTTTSGPATGQSFGGQPGSTAVELYGYPETSGASGSSSSSQQHGQFSGFPGPSTARRESADADKVQGTEMEMDIDASAMDIEDDLDQTATQAGTTLDRFIQLEVGNAVPPQLRDTNARVGKKDSTHWQAEFAADKAFVESLPIGLKLSDNDIRQLNTVGTAAGDYVRQKIRAGFDKFKPKPDAPYKTSIATWLGKAKSSCFFTALQDKAALPVKDEACDICQRKRVRLCYHAQPDASTGWTALLILPLPENLREGLQPDNIGYWVVDPKEYVRSDSE